MVLRFWWLELKHHTSAKDKEVLLFFAFVTSCNVLGIQISHNFKILTCFLLAFVTRMKKRFFKTIRRLPGLKDKVFNVVIYWCLVVISQGVSKKGIDLKAAQFLINRNNSFTDYQSKSHFSTTGDFLITC